MHDKNSMNNIIGNFCAYFRKWEIYSSHILTFKKYKISLEAAALLLYWSFYPSIILIYGTMPCAWTPHRKRHSSISLSSSSPWQFGERVWERPGRMGGLRLWLLTAPLPQLSYLTAVGGSLQCLIPSEPICVSGLPDVLRQRLLILVMWYEKAVYFSFV